MEEEEEKAPWYEKIIRIFLGVFIICISILFFILRIMPEKSEAEEAIPQGSVSLVSYLGTEEEMLEIEYVVGGIVTEA